MFDWCVPYSFLAASLLFLCDSMWLLSGFPTASLRLPWSFLAAPHVASKRITYSFLAASLGLPCGSTVASKRIPCSFPRCQHLCSYPHLRGVLLLLVCFPICRTPGWMVLNCLKRTPHLHLCDETCNYCLELCTSGCNKIKVANDQINLLG